MMRILVAALVGALGACASENAGSFLTTTKIAIDGDFTQQVVSVGYDRFEGFVGPAYETGAVPPVVARIDANTDLLRPQVRQFYATGNAAVYATCWEEVRPASATDNDDDPCRLKKRPEMTGNKRIMYFGTSSVIGLKVGFAGQQPDSVTFGYKRKEYSWLPILKSRGNAATSAATNANTIANTNAATNTNADTYGSVLASFTLDSDFQKFGRTGVGIGQFFATGAAAESIASQKDVKEEVQAKFLALARKSLEPTPVSNASGGN